MKYEDIVEEAWEPLHAHESIVSLQDALDDLAERYGAEITDHIELVRCLRWQIDHYKGKARELQERIDELEETNDGLRDDNMNLRAMTQSAYKKLFALEKKEAA